MSVQRYLLLDVVQDVFEVQVVVVVLDSLSYAALEERRRLREHTDGTVDNQAAIVWRRGERAGGRVGFTFFSKMRAMVRATAWSSSSTHRTHRNCGEEVKEGGRTHVKDVETFHKKNPWFTLLKPTQENPAMASRGSLRRLAKIVRC